MYHKWVVALRNWHSADMQPPRRCCVTHTTSLPPKRMGRASVHFMVLTILSVYTAVIAIGCSDVQSANCPAGTEANDDLGNAVVVWGQWDGTRNDVWGNRYSTNDGWATAERLENDNGDTRSPDVGVSSASGNATAVWPQYNGTDYDIWVNRFE